MCRCGFKGVQTNLNRTDNRFLFTPNDLERVRCLLPVAVGVGMDHAVIHCGAVVACKPQKGAKASSRQSGHERRKPGRRPRTRTARCRHSRRVHADFWRRSTARGSGLQAQSDRTTCRRDWEGSPLKPDFGSCAAEIPHQKHADHQFKITDGRPMRLQSGASSSRRGGKAGDQSTCAENDLRERDPRSRSAKTAVPAPEADPS